MLVPTSGILVGPYPPPDRVMIFKLTVLRHLLWATSTVFLVLGLSRPVIEVAVNVESVLKDAVDRQPIIGILLQERGIKLSELASKLPPSTSTRQSICSSVVKLYRVKCYTAATAILLFSILAPIVKQIALLLTLILPAERAQRISRFTQAIHKWAMLDVFALAMVVIALSSAAAWKATLLDGFLWFLAYFATAAVLGAVVARLTAPPDEELTLEPL